MYQHLNCILRWSNDIFYRKIHLGHNGCAMNVKMQNAHIFTLYMVYCSLANIKNVHGIKILAKVKLTNVVIWFSAILLLQLTYTNGQNRNHIIHRNKMLPLFTRKLETNDSLSTTKGRLNRTLMRNFLHATNVLESPRIREIIHL